jgi:hypothetical protein
MREIFKIIKEHFILLLGTGLFTYGLFSFNSKYYEGIEVHGIPKIVAPLSTTIRTYPIATYYYYNSTSLKLLAIGAIFIVIGLLKIRKKKGEN